MSEHRHGLRRRLVLAFALFALVTALCFSVFAMLFVYSVEDSFFDRMLEQEAAHQRAGYQQHGRPVAPLRPHVSVYRDVATLPDDLPSGVRNGEFMGRQGRHYHVRELKLADGAALILVAEVSRELVVRPRLPFLLRFLGISTLVILALTVAVGYWLAQRATEPLTRLTMLVSDAAPAHLPKGFADGFPDNEIGLLARRLEQALERIGGFIEREQHFTRDASHELRTPLAVIDGAAALLADQPMSPQAAQQLQRIRSATAQMAHTVDALLALAREELRAIPSADVALLPLVERAVVNSAHLLEDRDVEVRVEVPPDLHIRGHEGALSILLSNLIANAFSHTRCGVVRIHAQGGQVTVEDSGPGLPEHVRQQLFQPGVKGEDSRGHGLGLSIAHRLATRLGMTLSISEAPSGGTRAMLGTN